MFKQRVLILCTGNSARSQMAEGLLRHVAGKRFTIVSAGTIPTALKPEAIEVMRELGIDISSQRSKHVNEFAGQAFDVILTVCDAAQRDCPVFPGKTKRIHWSFPDPAAVEGTPSQRLAAFRDVRDRIQECLENFQPD